jgi:2-succinyl-6-hydroxy-2,4-cyclohexadiene-1-carboxylate synthase
LPFIVAEDLQYHFTRQGSGRPLILLHGFAGSSESWSALLPSLTAKFDVICFDLPGHGQSEAPAAAERNAMERVAGDIIQILDAIGVSVVSLLGYSMGGRLALYIALRYPELVARLILESSSPGLERTVDRQQRAVNDDRLAERIERFGVPAFVADWERNPIFASQRRLPPAVLARQRQQRLASSAAGLAGSLRGMGIGRQPNLWPELSKLKTPTLLMAGEMDKKFAQINRRMADLMPLARLEIVAHSGHNIHLEQPEAYLTYLQHWLL